MATTRKIVIHSSGMDDPGLLEELVADWKKRGVIFVGAVGSRCAELEDEIDELCVGDGSNPYFMLTSSHPGETLAEAIQFAEALSGDFSGAVSVVEF